MSYLIVKKSKEIDTLIFGMGGLNLFFPVLAAKFLRKDIAISALGRGSLSVQRSTTGTMGSFYASFTTIVENTNFRLAHKIIVESNIAGNALHLEKFAAKLVNCSPTFIDIEQFNVKTRVMQRANIIGYIGRISEEKGVRNFFCSVPLILQKNPNVSFLIGGYGPLFQELEAEIDRRNLDSKVKLVGWVSHDDQLPDYLNMLKLLVLPSYSEGLPAIILEAMACGTPVLVTPVGGLPEIVKEGQTGFILKNNSPECIAESTVAVLGQGNFDRITENAREIIKENFTYEAAVKKHEKLIGQLRGNC